MMMSEFTERTGYKPSSEEYHFIEESYYDFPGDKDAFCKQWMQDKADGHWQREMALRQTTEKKQSELSSMNTKYNELLRSHRELASNNNEMWEALKEAQEKLARLERCFRRTFDAE